MDCGVAFLLMAAFSFLPSALVPYLISERGMKEKRVQYVSGVSPMMYWTATFLWDLLMISIFVLLTGGIISIFDIPSFSQGHNFAAMLLLVFFFCTAATTCGYCLEKCFSEPSLGQLAVNSMNILLGVFSTLIIVILDSMVTLQVKTKS